MSRPKETHYFVEEIGFDIPRIRRSLKGESDYLRLFAAAGDATVIGESSTTYAKLARHAGVARRIADFNPDARIIYIMRDPIKRIESHYTHGQSSDWEPTKAPLSNGVHPHLHCRVKIRDAA